MLRRNHIRKKPVSSTLYPKEAKTGLVRDLRLLRHTVTLPFESDVRISSGNALGAAHRVFRRLKLVGMTKEEVLVDTW